MPLTSFSRNGFAVLPEILDTAECDALSAGVDALATASPGTRSLLTHDWCRLLAARLRAHPDIGAAIPQDFVAVQCTCFEKSREQNWLVPVHQDLSIPVATHVAHAALRGWSQKEGQWFVQPPVKVLEQLIALRVHLDPCGEDDGPLQFIPGTHVLGRIAADDASNLKRVGPVVTCVLDRGGVLMMRPLALHASSKASGSSRRRVLHFVFGPPVLPYGLYWNQA